jgi:hypothetical protein
MKEGGQPRKMNTKGHSLSISLLVTFIGFLVGLALHLVIVYYRDYGPTWGGFSLKGNGVLIFLIPVLLILIVGEFFAARYRAWLGMVLLPFALFLGLFVVLGGV